MPAPCSAYCQRNAYAAFPLPNSKRVNLGGTPFTPPRDCKTHGNFLGRSRPCETVRKQIFPSAKIIARPCRTVVVHHTSAGELYRRAGSTWAVRADGAVNLADGAPSVGEQGSVSLPSTRARTVLSYNCGDTQGFGG